MFKVICAVVLSFALVVTPLAGYACNHVQQEVQCVQNVQYDYQPVQRVVQFVEVPNYVRVERVVNDYGYQNVVDVRTQRVRVQRQRVVVDNHFNNVQKIVRVEKVRNGRFRLFNGNRFRLRNRSANVRVQKVVQVRVNH